MKAIAPAFSIVAAVVCLLPFARGTMAAERRCAVQADTSYPTFCSIPRAPTDVRSASAFRSAVIDERVSARDLQRRSSMGWSLEPESAAGFAAEARRDAEPPPQVTQSDTDADQFAREARERATPPRKKP